MVNNKISVNGPVNVTRLEGGIGNTKKVIYLFMDIHMDPDFQTECNNINSVDIKNYFIDNFNKISDLDKTYDFLFEMKPTLLSKKPTPVKGRYIDQVVKLFKKEFKINPKFIVSKSSQFPNIRLHYIDIRDYMKYTLNSNMYALVDYVNTIWRRMAVHSNDLRIIKDTINLLTARIKFIYDIIYNNFEVKNVTMKPMVPKTIDELAKYTEEDYNIRLGYIFKKLLNSYHNKKVHDILKKFFDTYIKRSFQSYFDSVKKLISGLDKMGKLLKKQSDQLYIDPNRGAFYGIPPTKIRAMIKNIYDSTEEVYVKWMNLHSDIMDVYFLRRFLDKDYITNGVTYTGIYHSINYIYVLVKYFDFKITHSSYIKYPIKKANSLIKEAKSTTDIHEIFYPKEFIQCSDMTSFPKLFK